MKLIKPVEPIEDYSRNILNILKINTYHLNVAKIRKSKKREAIGDERLPSKEEENVKTWR